VGETHLEIGAEDSGTSWRGDNSAAWNLQGDDLHIFLWLEIPVGSGQSSG